MVLLLLLLLLLVVLGGQGASNGGVYSHGYVEDQRREGEVQEDLSPVDHLPQQAGDMVCVCLLEHSYLLSVISCCCQGGNGLFSLMATTSVRSLQNDDGSMLASYETDPVVQVGAPISLYCCHGCSVAGGACA